MKIINREQFLKMPPGTLYVKYKPCYFYDMAIKQESTTHNDWYYSEIMGELDVGDSEEWSDKLFQYQETGESFKFDLDISQRDGLYEDQELYAIYEKEDIQMLINKLQELIKE